MKIHPVFTLFLIIPSTSCTTGSNSPVRVDDTSHIDTVKTVERIDLFPDTVYPSASRVRHSVHVADSAIDGRLGAIDDLYTSVPGVFTFRNGLKRDASFIGQLDSIPSKIKIDWVYRTPFDTVQTKYGRWGGGTGWTGQPLYVEWPDSCVSRFSGPVAKREIIFGSLDRCVHFVNFDSGKKSRSPIGVDNPVKGTVSLDPSLNGNLYVGHGVPAVGGFGAMVIDLYKNAIARFFGHVIRAKRLWNAYDSSPVRVDRFLFRPGENGTLYKFLIHPGGLRLQSSMSYTVDGRAPGMEASMAVCRNYGYTADNSGNIICINLNTLTPVWHYKLPDDTDATPVITEENGRIYLYVGCEVEHEGVTEASFAKLDAVTGKEVWIKNIPARRADVDEKHFDGGYYASPLPGIGNCSHLIFNNMVANTKGRNGKFVAFDRATGQIAYSVDLNYYSWSSPVGFIDRDSNMFVFTADCSGRVYLFNGEDGRLIMSERVGDNFESSPVVVGNSVVVGSRGTNVYKISVL